MMARLNRTTKTNGRGKNELRAEYDLASLKGGVRGKYYRAYQKGTNLVLLAPDVAKAFPDEQSVNEALRVLLRASKSVTAR
jgi:hypothetical protein